MSFGGSLALVALALTATFVAALPLPGGPALGDLELFKAGANGPPSCRPPSPPRRVVSVALLADEILLEILPLDRLAAVSYVVDWASSTPVSERFPKALPRLHGTAEQILASRPDLVVMSDYNGGGTAAQLAAAGLCVARLPAPRTFEGVLDAFRLLGAWTGEREAALRRVAELRAEIDGVRTLRSAAPHLSALVLQGSYTYGEDTLQDACIELAGLVNRAAVAGLVGTPSLNVEQLLGLDPDLIFLSTDTEAPRIARAGRLPATIPWEALRARRIGAVFEVPSSWVGSMSHHALRACRAYAELARSLR